MPNSPKSSKTPRLSELNFINQKKLIREFAMDAAQCFGHICDVADSYDCDREDALDLFLMMLENITEEIDIDDFNTRDKSYLS